MQMSKNCSEWETVDKKKSATDQKIYLESSSISDGVLSQIIMQVMSLTCASLLIPFYFCLGR